MYFQLISQHRNWPYSFFLVRGHKNCHFYQLWHHKNIVHSDSEEFKAVLTFLFFLNYCEFILIVKSSKIVNILTGIQRNQFKNGRFERANTAKSNDKQWYWFTFSRALFKRLHHFYFLQSIQKDIGCENFRLPVYGGFIRFKGLEHIKKLSPPICLYV